MSAALTRARKLTQARHRRKLRHFLAEGAHVLTEALGAGVQPVEAFLCRDSATDETLALARSLRSPVHEISSRELQEIADTRTPQGLVAVFAEPPEPVAPFASPGLWLLLDRVRDPGNAGTLLRAAEAFGVRGVIALRETVDLWSPRSVRAGHGAHFHLQLLGPGDPDVADAGDSDARRLVAFRAAGGEIWAAETGGDEIYDAPSPPPLCALAVGNEAGGLAAPVLAAAARRVAVPQRGRTESLNVAMAATVLLSWMSRGAATSPTTRTGAAHR